MHKLSIFPQVWCGVDFKAFNSNMEENQSPERATYRPLNSWKKKCEFLIIAVVKNVLYTLKLFVMSQVSLFEKQMHPIHLKLKLWIIHIFKVHVIYKFVVLKCINLPFDTAAKKSQIPVWEQLELFATCQCHKGREYSTISPLQRCLLSVSCLK